MRGNRMLGGRLHTGDPRTLDAQGNVYITDRLNRICKVLGLRNNWIDVEREFVQAGEVAIPGDDETLNVFMSAGWPEAI